MANGALDAGSRGEGRFCHTRVYVFQPSARQIACRKQSRLAQIPAALEDSRNAEFAQHTVYQSLRIRGQMRHFLHRGKHLAHAGGDRLQFTGLSDHIAHTERLQLLRVLLRQRACQRQGHRRSGQRVCRRQDRYAVALRQQKAQNQDIRLRAVEQLHGALGIVCRTGNDKRRVPLQHMAQLLQKDRTFICKKNFDLRVHEGQSPFNRGVVRPDTKFHSRYV